VSFHGIEEELRSQYALTYTPADFKRMARFVPSIFTATTALSGANTQGLLCPATTMTVAADCHFERARL